MPEAAFGAYLIMHAIAFGGEAQGIDAFWFPNPIACEQAKDRYKTLREQSAEVTAVYCTDKPPLFWLGDAPRRRR